MQKKWFNIASLNKYYFFKSFIMGRGDKKTKKGKTFKGSFGKSRPAKKAAKKAAKKDTK
jgi:30S ribosomal protein S31